MASIIVNNFSSFKSAITSGTYDTVILSADINIANNGVHIPITTADLTIDGLDPVTAIPHTITDHNSASIADTIYIASGGNIVRNITVKNLKLYGRNFYGIIGVEASSSNKDVTIKYQNVEYYGVQSFYNRYGKCIIEDSSIMIDKYDSINSTSEVAELNRLELAGQISITSHSTAFSTFWFLNSNPTFIVKENANVNIYTHSRELIYTGIAVDIIIEKNAIVNISCAEGMFYSTGSHRANNIEFMENSQFYFTQRVRNGSVSTVRASSIIAQKNSTVVIKVPYSPSAPLVEITTSGGEITLNDPKRFVLYNYGSRALYFSTGTGTLTANCEQINLWSNAAPESTAGTITNFPDKRWVKNDGSNVTMSANVTNTSTNIVSSNIEVPLDSTYPLDAINCPLHNVPVISFGRLTANIAPIDDQSSNITGTTEGNAQVQIGINSSVDLITADNDGKFDKQIIEPLKRDDKIDILIAKEFLYYTHHLIVTGSIHFLDVPQYLYFNNSSTPTNKSILNRQLTDWAILIKDTRVNGAPFEVYAVVVNPMQYGLFTIDDGLIFVDNQKSILGAAPTKIYTGQGNQQEETISKISYAKIKGILLEVIPDYHYASGVYQSQIIFTLQTEQ